MRKPSQTTRRRVAASIVSAAPALVATPASFASPPPASAATHAARDSHVDTTPSTTDTAIRSSGPNNAAAEAGWLHKQKRPSQSL